MPPKQLAEPIDVLYRVQRGLSGYISYLAACEMNESFSEYVLYEPILRVLTARGYAVRFEVVCPGIAQPVTGDKKKLDIVAAKKQSAEFAMEVKWAKNRALNVQKDREKLKAYLGKNPGAQAFLCVFGRKSQLQNLRIEGFCEPRGPVYAEFGKTRYGCRIFGCCG